MNPTINQSSTPDSKTNKVPDNRKTSTRKISLMPHNKPTKTRLILIILIGLSAVLAVGIFAGSTLSVILRAMLMGLGASLIGTMFFLFQHLQKTKPAGLTSGPLVIVTSHLAGSERKLLLEVEAPGTQQKQIIKISFFESEGKSWFMHLVVEFLHFALFVFESCRLPTSGLRFWFYHKKFFEGMYGLFPFIEIERAMFEHRIFDSNITEAQVLEAINPKGLNPRLTYLIDFGILDARNRRRIVPREFFKRVPNGCFYSIMANYGHLNLNDFNQDQLVAIGEKMLVALEIARGVADIHGAGFLHRDLKPSNIMIEQEPSRGYRAVIIDLETTILVPLEACLCGTPAYMIPAHRKIIETHNQPSDMLFQYDSFEADIYSLGAIFFKMFANNTFVRILEENGQKHSDAYDHSLERARDELAAALINYKEAFRAGLIELIIDCLRRQAKYSQATKIVSELEAISLLDLD